jgi:hypothetical protein
MSFNIVQPSPFGHGLSPFLKNVEIEAPLQVGHVLPLAKGVGVSMKHQILVSG